MWMVSPDKTIFDTDGRILYYSCDRFIDEIVLGGRCFLCGAAGSSRLFNDEHVIPEWILRRFGLFDKSITLQNGNKVRYGTYKVPCCVDCNTNMGKGLEEQISQIICGGISETERFLKENPLPLFVWMGLLFFKTHLNDLRFRFNLDRRSEEHFPIGHIYDWAEMHHLHTICRSLYTGTYVSGETLGSMLILPACEDNEGFDYCDLSVAQTAMVRIGSVAIISVFNDSCGALSYFQRNLDRITGPLTDIELREIMVELAWLNLHLKERPKYLTDPDLANERLTVKAILPELNLMDLDYRVRGAMLLSALGHRIPNIRIPGVPPEKIAEVIAEGGVRFFGNTQPL